MVTLLIDSNFLLHQARTTLPDLSTDEGVRTGLLYGILARTETLMSMFETNKVIFCWDSKTSRRKKIFPEYKGKRNSSMSEKDLAEKTAAVRQFPTVRSILKKMSFFCICKKGLEGDDLFASYVYNNPEETYIMITADMDMLQLLDGKGDRVTIYNPSSKKYFTQHWLMKEKGVTPEQWARVKAIGGCTSDNVPGLPGVGEGTAIKYVRNELKNNYKTYQTIESSPDQILFFMDLVKLPFKGTPVLKQPDFTYDIYAFKYTCEDYQLQSFLSDIDKWSGMFKGLFGQPGKRVQAKMKKRKLGL